MVFTYLVLLLAGYSFDLSINAVSGKNDTANGYNWKLERGCVSGKGVGGEWRYGPAEDTLLRSVSSNEVNTYVQNNSATIDDVNTTYQNASSTYITAINIPESADWNDTTDVVQANSSNWNDITAYQTISGDYLQEVSHDSSLSGNGTVDSPLGLNETVLWSGTDFSVANGNKLSATVQLSEPISAFEEIKIISSGNLDSETIVLDTSYKGGNGAFTWIAPEGGNAVWVGLRGVFTDQTHLKVYGGYSNTLASVFTANGWWHYKDIYKVVGINRIANN